jgi:hypothetical protein
LNERKIKWIMMKPVLALIFRGFGFGNQQKITGFRGVARIAKQDG